MKFLLANFIIFLTLTGAIYYQVSITDEVRIAKNVNQERAPASINPRISIEAPVSEKVSTADVRKEINKNIDCVGADKEVKTHDELVVISGSNCGKFKNIKITNLSNGFTASVFELSEKQYKTDLIPLTIGANKIFVEYQIISKKQQTLEKKTEFIIRRQ